MSMRTEAFGIVLILAWLAPPTAGQQAARRLNLVVGQTLPLQLSNRQPIRQVLNERDHVAIVRPKPDDPTTVLVTGVAPGRTRITLIGVNGEQEVLELGRGAGPSRMAQRK
jgi:hypothetical protein